MRNTQAVLAALFLRVGAMKKVHDRTGRTVSIHAIAAGWGFPRAADFTRAFRTAYGAPPRDYRLQALSRQVDVLPRRVDAPPRT
ncbi:hypothetical protein GCM10029978_112270 [Actinoallomurus acanthiterrae]